MAAANTISAQVFSRVERTVEAMGYALVDVERGPSGLLRVTLDIGGDAPVLFDADGQRQGPSITLDDCEKVSRQLSLLLGVENVDYDRLEVSSPGLDRRLRTARDFRRFTGAPVSVHLVAPQDGQRRLRGHVVEVAGDEGAETVVLAPIAEVPEGGVIRKSAAGARRPGPKASARKPASPSVAKSAQGADGAQHGGAASRVVVALASVDKARLIPVIDFRASAEKTGKAAGKAAGLDAATGADPAAAGTESGGAAARMPHPGATQGKRNATGKSTRQTGTHHES